MAYDELTKAVTVTEANRLIKEALDVSFYQIVIKGEISGFRPSSSGHAYFDLKDRDASIPCCIFKSSLHGMFKFQNGDLVTATGRISLWEKTGKLSFIITKMVRQGDGELQALIEKRKLYYQNLGWFDPAIKKPLPENITKVGVVTSATGAVIHDILDVTRRRAPSLDIILFPCAVQGQGAEITIASRIRQANNFDACDVLIVGRGGGSAEDLAPFSEDDVIIAIHESHIPVISA
ncbi:MAG: exodeoxyribonuclease VII large subunit, partial [Spirochaetales bacterium]|nr:exodeoxyribonuclease VII large subunit [Candidatus Physcosoma equi]